MDDHYKVVAKMSSLTGEMMENLNRIIWNYRIISQVGSKLRPGKHKNRILILCFSRSHTADNPSRDLLIVTPQRVDDRWANGFRMPIAMHPKTKKNLAWGSHLFWWYGIYLWHMVFLYLVIQKRKIIGCISKTKFTKEQRLSLPWNTPKQTQRVVCSSSNI